MAVFEYIEVFYNRHRRGLIFHIAPPHVRCLPYGVRSCPGRVCQSSID